MKLFTISCLMLFLSNIFFLPAFTATNREKIASRAYDKKKVLKKFAKQFNYLSKYYHDGYPRKYEVTSISSYNFWVADLVDTTNSSLQKEDLYFTEGHIYVISTLNYNYLYYNIVFLNKGNLIFFRAVNCKNYINSLEEVIKSAEIFLIEDYKKKSILNRLKSYKKYSSYYKMDAISYPVCE
jgi:hypothetical protein